MTATGEFVDIAVRRGPCDSRIIGNDCGIIDLVRGIAFVLLRSDDPTLAVSSCVFVTPLTYCKIQILFEQGICYVEP